MKLNQNLKKILAIKFRAMGDTILATATLNELRRAYPQAEIHVAVMQQWAPLLEHHPAVDKIWTYVRHREMTSRAKALTRLAISLRKERYDCVINLHASPSSAKLSYATGARLRSIHFHGHKHKNRHSTVTIPDKGVLKPIIERDMDALRAIGIQVPPGRLPEIHLNGTETEEAAAFVKMLQLKGPILAIGLGSSRPTKSWPVERFAGLAAAWCKEVDGSVLALAGGDESPLTEAFGNKVDEMLSGPERERVVVRTGLPLRSLAAVISQCSAFVGNDSGPRHLAVAVGLPTITVFGPEDPFEWHPYPLESHPYLFVPDLKCRNDAMPGMPPWCGLHTCVVEHHRCMQEIGINQVLAECKRVRRQ